MLYQDNLVKAIRAVAPLDIKRHSKNNGYYIQAKITRKPILVAEFVKREEAIEIAQNAGLAYNLF